MQKKLANRILYEDNHLLIVDKLAGELSQGDQTGDVPIIEKAKIYIKHKYNKPGAVFCGLIHRLDRPTSGVIALARTSKALTRMNKLFSDRDVKKSYFALVSNAPSQTSDRLVHYLKKDGRNNKVNCITQARDGYKKAILNYRLLKRINGISLIEIELETGRPHQIRVQLSFIGSPIIGDLKYNYTHPNDDASICLHCHKLEFIHPTKKVPVRVISDFPKNKYWKAFID